MKVIFLDVDGVLNNADTTTKTSNGWCFVDDYLVDRLKTLVDKTDSKLVLSSTWRDGWKKKEEDCDNDFLELRDKLAEYGMSLYDKIPDRRDYNRSLEIKEWLDSHTEVNRYVILDDYESMEDHKDFVVMTDPDVGLSEEDALKAEDILNKIIVCSKCRNFLNNNEYKEVCSIDKHNVNPDAPCTIEQDNILRCADCIHVNNEELKCNDKYMSALNCEGFEDKYDKKIIQVLRHWDKKRVDYVAKLEDLVSRYESQKM